jgi:hypothetical protein
MKTRESQSRHSLHADVSCEAWNVQQLAAGGRWNTLLSENNQSDAERAVKRLAKSGERNLRIQVQRAANAAMSDCAGGKLKS